MASLTALSYQDHLYILPAPMVQILNIDRLILKKAQVIETKYPIDNLGFFKSDHTEN